MSFTPLKQAFPGAIQGGIYPCETSNGWKELPSLDALPIAGAQPDYFSSLFLGDSYITTQCCHIPSELGSERAGFWFFGWHARYLRANRNAENEALPRDYCLYKGVTFECVDNLKNQGVRSRRLSRLGKVAFSPFDMTEVPS